MMSIEISGRIASTLSARPRFELSVMSVTYALKAASFAVLPKKVITQSIMTTSIAADAAAFAPGKSRAAFAGVMYPKAAVESPQRI